MASQDSQPFHWHYSEFDDRNFQIRGQTLFFLIVLFAVVLLLTLLILYARWVCGAIHVHAASNPHPVHPPPSQPQGLDPSTINSFPIVLHRSSSRKTVDETDCCICLGVFEDGDKVKVLPECRHCYHSECVDIWLRSQTSCPLCRSSLRADSPV